MIDIKEIRDVVHNRLLRLGLMLASTLAIVTTSALVYAGAVFQKALNVDATSGATGAGSTASSEIGIPFATIVILVLQAFLVSLSVFGFPPKLPKLLIKSQHDRHSLPPTHRSKPDEKEEWEESAGKDEPAKTNKDVVGDILESLRKKDAATNQ
ncbi:MAG TPA: hypothetical protein VGA05_06690 [Candidatus Bathyarchaeia archaeon]